MKCDAIVDAHVHLHDCYAPARFFAAALANFASIARRQKLPAGAPAYLLMTECAGDGAFEELERQSSAQSPRLPLGEWRVSRTAEEQSIRVTGPGGELYVIAGRQVACREGLEVLLPGTRASFTDGLSIHETLALGAAAGLPR